MRTYQNPVCENYFADPFVWKQDGKYYAVGTGPLKKLKRVRESDLTSYLIHGEHRAIPVLTSDDFVNWKSLGGALRVPKQFRHKVFWAPEVAFHDGWFFLYYSTAAVGLRHQIRVAKSSAPEGPYEDVCPLIGATKACPFAIDAHPFRDDDGQWYLFYGRDFLDCGNGVRAGTALVVDKLTDMTKLAGEERVVLRARNDWQLFKAQRKMYGKIFDWHTLEGPFVRKHDGRYFCFYSGGCYKNETYGIDCGIAERVIGPYSDAGNEEGPRVLKSIPRRVIGPGHHSIVMGPDDRTEFIAYHAWDVKMEARRMCLDKLVWTESGPRCAGATWTPQLLAESEFVGLKS